MRIGSSKIIDGSHFSELVNDHGQVIGYVKAITPVHAEYAFNQIVLDSDVVKDMDSAFEVERDAWGEKYYQATHPQQKPKKGFLTRLIGNEEL